MAEQAIVVAHLIGGDRLHAADAVFYGLAALGLCAGIGLLASGRAGKPGHPADASPAPRSDPAESPDTPLAKTRIRNPDHRGPPRSSPESGLSRPNPRGGFQPASSDATPR